MKKIVCFIAMVATLGAFSSCQDNYSSVKPSIPNVRNNMQGDFTCGIDGIYFKAETIDFKDTTVENIRTLSIVAIAYEYTRKPNDRKVITINIADYKGPGVYPVYGNPWVSTNYYTSLKEWSATFIGQPLPENSDASYINIKTDNSTISGNFTIEMKEVDSEEDKYIWLTSGEFSFPR